MKPDESTFPTNRREENTPISSRPDPATEASEINCVVRAIGEHVKVCPSCKAALQLQGVRFPAST